MVAGSKGEEHVCVLLPDFLSEPFELLNRRPVSLECRLRTWAAVSSPLFPEEQAHWLSSVPLIRSW